MNCCAEGNFYSVSIARQHALHAEFDRPIILPSGYSGFVKQGTGSPDEARMEQTPYPFQPH